MEDGTEHDKDKVVTLRFLDGEIHFSEEALRQGVAKHTGVYNHIFNKDDEAQEMVCFDAFLDVGISLKREIMGVDIWTHRIQPEMLNEHHFGEMYYSPWIAAFAKLGVHRISNERYAGSCDELGRPHGYGTMREFNDDTQKRIAYTFTGLFEHDEYFDGIEREYFDDDDSRRVCKEAPYKNGFRSGVTKTYFNNPSHRVDEELYYDEDSKLFQSVEYFDDDFHRVKRLIPYGPGQYPAKDYGDIKLIHGTVVEFFNDAAHHVKKETQFQYGVKHGDEVEYLNNREHQVKTIVKHVQAEQCESSLREIEKLEKEMALHMKGVKMEQPREKCYTPFKNDEQEDNNVTLRFLDGEIQLSEEMLRDGIAKNTGLYNHIFPPTQGGRTQESVQLDAFMDVGLSLKKELMGLDIWTHRIQPEMLNLHRFAEIYTFSPWIESFAKLGMHRVSYDISDGTIEESSPYEGYIGSCDEMGRPHGHGTIRTMYYDLDNNRVACSSTGWGVACSSTGYFHHGRMEDGINREYYRLRLLYLTIEKVSRETKITNGRKIVTKEYFKDRFNRLKRITHYKMNKIHGDEIEYHNDETHSVKHVVHYEDGVPISS